MEQQFTGKIPRRMGTSFRINRELSDLRHKLRQAIEREEYEKAAEYRDRLKSWKAKISQWQVLNEMINKVITRAQSNWTKAEGPHHHIVISSRIRLARNLKKLAMPAFQKETDGFSVLEKVKKAAENISREGKDKLYFYLLQDIPPLERQILEKHW